MFYEELVNKNNTSEENISLIEQRDIITEQLDFIIDILNESYFDDLKIKKKDLLDPNKVKAIIRKIEKENITQEKKDILLNFLYAILMAMVAVVPGYTIALLGVVANSGIVACLGELIMLTSATLVPLLTMDRFQNLISKTKKAIKKVQKQLKKENDPQLRSAYLDQLKALEWSLNEFQKADYKRKKDISDKTRYNYSY